MISCVFVGSTCFFCCTALLQSSNSDPWYGLSIETRTGFDMLRLWLNRLHCARRTPVSRAHWSSWKLWAACGSLGHHHFHKLLIVDLAITINVSLTDHLVHLFIRELLTKVGHDVAQLSSTDEAIAIAIENLEGFNQLFFGIGIPSSCGPSETRTLGNQWFHCHLHPPERAKLSMWEGALWDMGYRIS